MRWHYRDRVLVWLFPAAYALHILEEWVGGFPEWLAVFGGEPMPRWVFAVINAIAFSAMLLAVTIAR